MPVPWEAFLPIGAMIAMFAVTGTALKGVRMIQGDGKPPRYSLDRWEEMMMKRDKRMTGSLRGQQVEEKAPADFLTGHAAETEAF